ncbi:MAG: N-acyl-D-amino-acid deacylase family protein [Balneolaceae bacterium]
MKIPFANLLSGLLLLVVSAACVPQEPLHGDLLIINAAIVDGTGEAAFTGHLLITGPIIEAMGHGDPHGLSAADTLDATGYTLSPGFIDTHAHGDPLATPRFDNFLSMGVTTIALGQDGSSPDIENVSAWMDRVHTDGTGPNVLYFAGHNSLRRAVNAPRRQQLPDGVPEQMEQLLGQAMQAGAFGMSTGLEYDHGRFSGMEELAALATVVHRHGGIVMSHMRNEDDDQVAASLEELIEQGRRSGAPVHASHLKIVFGNDPSQSDSLLQRMQNARSEGISITGDVYPYTASFTGISIVFPEWALPPNDYQQVLQERREELADYLRTRVAQRNGPEATLFGTAPWAGKTLADVADERGKPFEEVLMEDIGPGGASAAYFVMDNAVMRQFVKDPYVMVSSDGSPTMRHPRGYGSFAKIIHQFVVEEDHLSLEEAIRMMTTLPAQTLGLLDEENVQWPRGVLRAGAAADLLLFNPDEVRDLATFENPHQYAAGFEWVFVNGVAVIEQGERNEYLPSGVIRRKNRP